MVSQLLFPRGLDAVFGGRLTSLRYFRAPTPATTPLSSLRHQIQSLDFPHSLRHPAVHFWSSRAARNSVPLTHTCWPKMYLSTFIVLYPLSLLFTPLIILFLSPHSSYPYLFNPFFTTLLPSIFEFLLNLFVFPTSSYRLTAALSNHLTSHDLATTR
jgi:hypothetical protein